MRRLIAIFAVSLLPLSVPSAAVPDFHRPAAPSGSLELRLHPTEAVTTSTPVLVTFGLPLPRGSLSAEELSTVRLLREGLEIPAHVEMLTPWRHATAEVIDGASVRVARIQFEYSFTGSVPQAESITVQWGGPARTQSQDFRDPRSAWHQVQDGVTATGGPTFGSSHNVYEPDVYALLPAEWLATSGLKSPSARMPESISLTRVTPTEIAASFPDYEEADQAQVDFFYTVINEDDPNLAQTANNTNYFSQDDAEPWLYDRAMAFYVGYLRTGDFRFLREAVRNADYYRQQLFTAADCSDGPCVGSFRLTNPDPNHPYPDAKYSYNESLAMTYWLTGDEAALARIRDVPRVYDDTPTTPNPTFFTERHAAFKWLANIVAYEVTGEQPFRDALLSILENLRAAQESPPVGLPRDGGIWHSIRAHEGDDDPAQITSPWMSALIVDAAARAYLITDEPGVAQLIRGLADHVCGVGSYMTTIRNGENGLSQQSGGAPLRFPHYLATTDGLGWTSEFDPYSNFEHSFDTAAVAAWGAYFAALDGADADTVRLLACGDELYTSFSHVVTYWTRPGSINVDEGYDAYRAAPGRKYVWWFKNTSGFAWAMAAARSAETPPQQNQPPSITLTSPAAGARFVAGANITLTANAVDGDGSIQRVDFYQGDTLLASDSTAPYSFSWAAVTAGTYSVAARATDDDGATADSAVVSITVEGATAPADGGGGPSSGGGGSLDWLALALLAGSCRLRRVF